MLQIARFLHATLSFDIFAQHMAGRPAACRVRLRNRNAVSIDWL